MLDRTKVRNLARLRQRLESFSLSRLQARSDINTISDKNSPRDMLRWMEGADY